jgi:hypothetical protein
MNVVEGRAALSGVAAGCEASSDRPSFVSDGSAIGHHGIGVLRRRAGPTNGNPLIAGADATAIAGGCIARRWVLIDQSAG